MAQDSRQVASNQWGAVTHFPEWNTLELKWLESTRSMDEDGFKETLQLLADQGLAFHPSCMIIDATEFFHRPTGESLAWRDENIVPLYNRAGVQKFAFVVNEAMPGTVEKGGVPMRDGPAEFETGWFETRERLYAWLQGDGQ